MSRNQSRTVRSTWILWRFEPLPLGSSSTSAAAGVVGAAGSADVSDLIVCERSGDGLSWSPPARPLQADTMANPDQQTQGSGARSARTSLSEEDARSTSSLADEALHREAVEKHFAGTKHLFECKKDFRNNRSK